MDKNDDIRIRERLIILRKMIFEMSQKEFSEYLGLPQSTLSSYESGKMSPSLSMTFMIAKKCNVTMDWLCGNDKKTKVESIADIAEFFFELFEMKDIDPKQTRLGKAQMPEIPEAEPLNLGGLTFIAKSTQNPSLNKRIKFDYDLAHMVGEIAELADKWKSYSISQEDYDKEKKALIERYQSVPIAQFKKRGRLSEAERLRRNILLLQGQLDALQGKKKKDDID